MKDTKLPDGWDPDRIAKVIQHYEGQTDEESLAEDEEALLDPGQIVMEIPADLVPIVRQLIARRVASGA